MADHARRQALAAGAVRRYAAAGSGRSAPPRPADVAAGHPRRPDAGRRARAAATASLRGEAPAGPHRLSATAMVPRPHRYRAQAWLRRGALVLLTLATTGW